MPRKMEDEVWTPLHIACDEGHLDEVMSLVEQDGAAVEERTDSGWTPLLIACLQGHLRCGQVFEGAAGCCSGCPDQ
jgi:ankyrin repeat protein